ncbi:hypothetical protein BGZ58_003117 [Dissophora ornata]|nr:hypothetical protein BGZ58_003117 [Dissophora ornata]
MPMFFPCESPSIYQQIIDGDASADLLLPQQQQQQQAYQAFAEQQKSQQPFPCGLNQIGLGTPPTSPPTPAFHKYPCGGADLGAAIYGSQPQAIQNVYVIPVQQTLQTQQTQQQLLTPQQQQEELAYHMLMQQFDNLESSLFSPSPTTSSCCSSLSNSPYAESPLMAIGSDFDLFPINTNNGASGVQSAGYPSAPVLAPSAAMATAAQAIIYGQTAGVYHQMTPPMNSMDLDRDISLFKSDAINIGSVTQQPLTTELSLLCKCPGKFPCGEQLLAAPIELASPISSPLQEVLENSEFSDESESMSSSEEEENEAESDPSYQPSSRAGPSSKKNSIKARPKSMVISTSGGAPYSSPFSKESSSTPSTPVRQDRRRSSSGSFSSFGGHAHNQQLIDPKKVPEIKDIHVCPVCQRRFTRPFNLRSHLMTHTTARPFPCDECDWKFTRQHDLLRHKRAKHPSSGSPSPTPKKEPTESGPASEV